MKTENSLMMIPSKTCDHSLYFHLIFVVKYRKKLLIKYGEKIKELLLESAEQSKKFSIHHLEYDQDHVHMMIEMHPTETISNVVKRLKSYTTFHIWQFDEENLKNQFWKEKMFWSKSFFVRSVGEVNYETVKVYIQNQGKERMLNNRKIHPSW